MLRPEITMELRGKMTERFLNACRAEGTGLYSAANRDGTLYISFPPLHRDGVLRAAKASHMHILSEKALGLYSALFLLVRRRAFFPALAACIIAVWFSGLFLHRTEVKGPSGYTSSRIAAVLDSAVKPGMPLSSIDTDELEDLLQSNVPEISWAGVGLDGCVLKAEYTKKIVPEGTHADTSSDIIAARDGVIVSIAAFEGSAKVKPGDTVKKGQVLISGEYVLPDGTTTRTAASGTVKARIWTEAAEQGCADEWGLVPTGRTASAYGIKSPFALPRGAVFDRYDESSEEFMLCRLYLPVCVIKSLQTELAPAEDAASLAAGRLGEKAAARAALLLPEGAAIVDKWQKYSIINEREVSAHCIIEATAEIGCAAEGE